jgi:hypothetical protein
VGDSLGKFVSAGIPSCGGERYLEPDRASGSLAGHTAATNELVRWAERVLSDAGSEPRGEGRRPRALHPEDYCYFGVEGNPAFTKRLKRLQELLMHGDGDGDDSYSDPLGLPPPVRSARFYTETVGAGADGPVTFYLDTVNEGANYWGSSLLATHRDIQHQSEPGEKGGGPRGTTVQGITLTSLLRRHVDAGAEGGGHVIIKMDVEGAEFAILNEASDSGILCELKEKGFRIDALVEFHSEVRCSIVCFLRRSIGSGCDCIVYQVRTSALAFDFSLRTLRDMSRPLSAGQRHPTWSASGTKSSGTSPTTAA